MAITEQEPTVNIPIIIKQEAGRIVKMREYESRNVESDENKIDIIQGIVKGWKCFKKTWWLLLILAAVGVGIAGVYRLSA